MRQRSSLQAEEERSLQQRRVQLARNTLARNEQLAKEGFVAAAQVQSRQEELIDADGRLQSLERQRLAVQHDLQALRGERTALEAQLRADLNQIQRSRSSLDQEASENAARKSTVITAPYAGTVTALNLKVGQSVQTGQTLATLVPQADASKGAALQAHLFAPSRTAGFVRPGQTVYLRYAAYPYQKFGLHTGHITAVSATPFAPSELPANLAQQLIAQAGSNEALYRINVQLDEQSIKACRNWACRLLMRSLSTCSRWLRNAPGFAPGTPLHGWSMSKTVNGMLLHKLAAQTQLSLESPVVDAFPPAREPAWAAAWRGDERKATAVHARRPGQHRRL